MIQRNTELSGDKLKFLKNDIVKLLLITIPIAVFIFLFNYLTPLFADDYSYSFVFGGKEKINSIFDILSSRQKKALSAK